MEAWGWRRRGRLQTLKTFGNVGRGCQLHPGRDRGADLEDALKPCHSMWFHSQFPKGVLETAGPTLWGTRIYIFMRFWGDLLASETMRQPSERGTLRWLAAQWGEEMVV